MKLFARKKKYPLDVTLKNKFDEKVSIEKKDQILVLKEDGEYTKIGVKGSSREFITVSTPFDEVVKEFDDVVDGGYSRMVECILEDQQYAASRLYINSFVVKKLSL